MTLSRNLITIMWKEFWNYMQFNLLVTSLDSLIIVLPALSLARSFIMWNAISGNKSTNCTIILISFTRLYSHMSWSPNMIYEKLVKIWSFFIIVFNIMNLQVIRFYNQIICSSSCIPESINTPHLRELSSDS